MTKMQAMIEFFGGGGGQPSATLVDTFTDI